MKILLTGGGTGGHFYPLIAVAQALRDYAREHKILDPQIHYMASKPYDSKALFDNDIEFHPISAGKVRRYFSILNFFDFFRTGWGIIEAILAVWNLYPDVVFSKGGYVSFPVVFAARILRIPVVIHESDSVPGKVNLWSGKFAKKIALSFKEAGEYFPQEKIAWTGNPVRKEILDPLQNGAHEFLKLNQNIPTILVLGGSQGSQLINDIIIDSLPDLLRKYQIIHQTGKLNFKSVSQTALIAVQDADLRERYHPFEYLNDLAMRMSAGAADIIISRAGSTIFEIASWGIPSVLIPITDSNGDHQRQNAFNYARTGAATVVEEINLTTHILIAEIDRLMDNKQERDRMSTKAKEFAHRDASLKIAGEIMIIALKHEK